MASFEQFVKRHKRPYIESLKDDIIARKNPDFFWPNGTQVYVGRQGSGKTISAVKHLLDIKRRYPKCIIVSNLSLTNFTPITPISKEEIKDTLTSFNPKTQYLYFDSMEKLALYLVEINNGHFGVVYIIDEIHTYFNSLESSNIPMFVFTEISQQRKQRKLIIGTSQLFMRMAKPLREQCDNIIVCKTKFGVFTSQVAYDGMSLQQDYDGNLIGQIKKRGFFFQTRKIRSNFDTYQKVVSGADQFESFQKVEIMHKKGKFSLK